MNGINLEKFKEDLAHVVNIDSGSYDLGGIAEVGRFFYGEFEKLGLKVTEFDNFNRVEARTHDCEESDVMFVGHMDTVFPKGTAGERPYTEEGDFARGPGVADMKGGLVLALHLTKKLIKERPDVRICICFNGDEEISSLKSTAWLQSCAKNTRYAFVFEPGKEGKGFCVSRKGNLDFELKAYGVASHAGAAPEKGANAILEVANWITELSKVQNLEEGTSVSAGIINGGIASNVIPDYCETKFDIRYTTHEGRQKVLNKIEELKKISFVKGVRVEIETPAEYLPMEPNSNTKELMTKLDSIADKLNYEIAWIKSGGVSDANNIAGIGTTCICACGPCGDNLHRADEYLIISSIEKRFNLMYELISEII